MMNDKRRKMTMTMIIMMVIATMTETMVVMLTPVQHVTKHLSLSLPFFKLYNKVTERMKYD